MIFWYVGLEGEYLCNDQVFTFAPSLSTYSLSPIYYFTSRGVFDCVVISSNNNMVDIAETKVIKQLSNFLTINFKGNVTLDFTSEYYIYTFLRFLDDNLGDLGIVIVTIPPQDAEPFLKIFDVIETDYFNRYNFVFLYADVMALIPSHYKNNNFYFLSQYYYDPNNTESVELESVIYDIKTKVNIPYQMVEMLYSTATAARKYFVQLKSPDPSVIRENVNKIDIDTPHGISRLSTDYHFTYPSVLLHYLPGKLNYEMVYTNSNNDNSTVYFNINEPCGMKSSKIFNIGLIVCPEDISSYPLSDIFHFASSTVQFVNDKLLDEELLLSLKHIQICELNGADGVYQFIKDNNISVVIGYECSCGLLFENFIHKDEYLILSTNPSVSNYIDPNVFHFGVSPTSSVYPILSLLKMQMITRVVSLYSVNNRNEFYFDIYRSEFHKFGMHIINEIGIQWNVTDLSALALDISEYVSHYHYTAIFSRLESPQFISLINTFTEYNISGLKIVYNSPIALSQLKKLNLNGNSLYYVDGLGAISSAINQKLATSEYLRQLKPSEYDYVNGYTSTFLLAIHYLVVSIIKVKSMDIERIKENFHEMNVENYFGNTWFNKDNYMNHNLDIIMVNSSNIIGKDNNIFLHIKSKYSYYSKNTLPLIENICVLNDIPTVVHKIAILTSVSFNRTYSYGEIMIIIGSILDEIVKTSKMSYLYQIYDSCNDINRTKELVEKITSQEDIRHIICNLDVLVVKEIYPLIRTDQILWYTKHTTGEYCYKNVINTGPVPNQVIYHLIPHLLYHGYNTCIVYYLNIYPYTYYKEAFLEFSKGKINVILKEYNVDFTREYEFTRLVNSKIPFIFLLPKTETYVAYNLLMLNHYNFYDTPVISLYYDYLKADYGYLDGLYFVTQFNKTSVYHHFKDMLNQYLITSKATSSILSSYLAIQFIIKTTSELNRTNYTIDEFHLELSKQSVYEYKFENNNYLQHYFHILRYITNEKQFEIHQSMSSMVEPLNFFVSSSQTINTTKICDIYSESGIVIQRQLFVLLLMSFTGEKSFYDFGLMESIELSLYEINNENLLPFKLVLLTENMNCNESNVVELVNKYTTNSTVLAVFYSGSKYGKDLLKPIIKKNDMLLFYLNINDGEECEKNIVYCSYSTSHFIQASISFYSVNYPESTVILIAREFNYMFSIMYKLLLNRRMTVVRYENPNESGDIIANKIIEQYGNDFVIWTDLVEEDLSLLSTTLSQYNLDNFYNINYEIYIPNFRFQQIQYYNITDVDFILLYSEKNEEFIKYKNKLLSSSYTKLISNRMVVGYTMMKLLSQALYNITYTTDKRYYNSENNNNNNNYNSYDDNEDYDFSSYNILLQLYNKEYDGPMGLIKVESNNYLRLNFYARRLNSELKEGMAYLNLVPNPFSIFGKYEKGNHYCDWLIDKKNGDELEISPIYTVILLINYNNKHYSEIYRYLFESLVQFRNTEEETLEFNKQLPIFLTIQQVDITDNEKEIEETVRNYLNNNDLSKVIGIIGGIFSFERDAIIKGIGDKKIIYFYPGYTEAEYCYQNVISTGPVNGILKEELVYHLHSYKGYIIVVKAKAIVSEHFYKQFMKVSTLSGLNVIKTYEYSVSDYNLIYDETVKMVNDMKDNVCVNKECIIINLSSYSYNLIKVAYEDGLLRESSTWKLYNVLYMEKNYKKDIFPGLHNVYMVSTFYCKDYITEERTYQDFISNKIKNYFSNVIPCNAIVEAAISTINLLITTLSRVSVYDYNNILKMLHEKTYNSPSGDSVLYPNNFVSKNVYILELNENGSYSYIGSSITPIVPKAYPSFDANYYGIDCIWNKIQQQKKVIQDDSFVIVSIIYEGYDYLIKTARTHVYITLKFLDSINTYTQKNSTLFIPYFYIYTNDDELFDKTNGNNDVISSFFEYDNFGIIIGCLYPKCRDRINKLAVEYNKVFMYTGINDGVFGSKNTISFGVTFHQSLTICMDYFGNGESKSLLVIVDNTDFGNNLLKEFNAFQLNRKYYTVLKIYQITEMNITYANEIIDLIENNKNLMIINLLYSIDLANYVKLVVGSTKKIPIHIMFYYNEYVFDINEIKKLTGDYFFSSFISNSNNVNNLGFISLVRNVIDTPISYFMDNNNVALHFISENYIYDLNMIGNNNKENNVVTTEMFLATIFYHTYSGLTGELSVDYSHNLNRKSYLFEIQDSTINAHVYPRLSDENNVSISSINTNYFGPEKVKADERKSIFITNIIFVVVAFIVVTLAWIFSIHYRNLQIVKQYNLISINITMLIYYFFILTGIIELITPRNDGLCVARLWFVSIGTSLVLITYLVKSLKFQSLVNATIPSSPAHSSNTSSRKGNGSRYGSTNSLTSLKSKIFHNYKFSFSKPLLYTLIVQILYLTIWTLSIMPKSKEIIIESDDIYTITVSYKCEINQVFLYLYIYYLFIISNRVVELFIYANIIIWSIIFSYTTRNLNTQFKENIVTLTSVMYLSVMNCILFGAYFAFSDNREVTQLARVSGVCLSIIVLILIQYLPMIYYFFNDNDAKLAVGGKHENTTTWNTDMVKETHILSESNNGKPKRRSDFVLTQDSRYNRHSTSVKSNKRSLATLTTPRNRKALSTSIPPIRDENIDNPINNQEKVPFAPDGDIKPQIPRFKVDSDENSSNMNSGVISSYMGNKRKMEIKGSQEIKGNSAEGTIGSFQSPMNLEFRKAQAESAIGSYQSPLNVEFRKPPIESTIGSIQSPPTEDYRKTPSPLNDDNSFEQYTDMTV